MEIVVAIIAIGICVGALASHFNHVDQAARPHRSQPRWSFETIGEPSTCVCGRRLNDPIHSQTIERTTP